MSRASASAPPSAKGFAFQYRAGMSGAASSKARSRRPASPPGRTARRATSVSVSRAAASSVASGGQPADCAASATIGSGSSMPQSPSRRARIPVAARDAAHSFQLSPLAAI